MILKSRDVPPSRCGAAGEPPTGWPWLALCPHEVEARLARRAADF
jgi:hypothetical protein